ncbi:hypothetical protein [Flavobacterium faecale]|uniref:hypothetical protein n=1 Tax=Flavobacterium faecale TaxID=1355330 RepID=UPI003AAF3313
MKINKIKIVFLMIIGLSIVSCTNNDPTDPNDPKYNDLDNNDNGPTADVVLTVDASDKIAINPEIFGVNNDWKQIPNSTFTGFANMLKSINYTVVRYPGGWESEYYDWDTNTTPTWNSAPSVAGASIETLKSNINSYSIVIPTTLAMDKAVGSAQFNTAVETLKVKAEKAITKAGLEQSGIIEIGNEWWLQWAGGVSRAEKLTKYTNIAMALAAHLNIKYPNHKFKLLVNGDYTKPEEFTTMKQQFTTAYDVIDGVALHTYAGYQTDTHNMSELESRIKACATNFNPNKKFIYLSEWMPSRDYNDRALYMEAANIIPDMIQIYARSNANAAAYWPPVNTSIPGLGLTNWNFSTVFPVGQIMGELSKSYKGFALKTISNKFHIAAALNDAQTMVVFVTGGKETAALTAVKVANFTIGSIEKIERYVPADYNETNKAASYITEEVTAKLNKNNEVVFNVNKEGKYQIYKIVLKAK